MIFYLCSYYFSYFAFNGNKDVQTIYLLLWIYFYVNYIYLQIHHHHVDMLCYYKTLTTNMSSNIFNCCIYRAAADTFVNDFTWTHCASCLFNTAWFIFMLLLIGPSRADISDTPHQIRENISNLRNKLFIMLFEQKKPHLWHSCCPISLVISNMKFNSKLSEQFGEFDVSPYKVIGAALGCLRGVSKMAAEWHDLS